MARKPTKARKAAEHTLDQIASIANGAPELLINKTTVLSSGSTLLNLASTGRPDGAFVKGGVFFWVGSSSSGKTFWTLTALAEAAINENFKGYRFYYDNAERAPIPDPAVYFGQVVADRMEPPAWDDDGHPAYSDTVERFYHNATAKVKEGPCIYMIDSLDALTSNHDLKKFAAMSTELEGGKAVTGDYGDGKAKYHSRYLRSLVQEVMRTGSILILISQERDNIGGGMFDPKNTHAGGRALKFYCSLQMWATKGSTIKKEYRKKKRQQGIVSRVRVAKNKLTGKEWTVEVPIYHSYGIDDVGSCLDFLVEEQHWKRSGGVIYATELELQNKKEALAADILADPQLLKRLRIITGRVWREIEQAVALERPARYS